MSNKLLLDENKQYQFDFSKTEYVIELHELANSLNVNDVDFITGTHEQVIFLEYKNADIKDAVNPDALLKKIETDKFISNIAKKYYDSILLFWGKGFNEENRPINYILLIEHAKIDMRIRKQLRNKLMSRLPMRKANKESFKGFISSFQVYNLKEWNDKFNYIKITPVNDN